MAKQQNITWVSEAEAAKMVGLTPMYFRRKVKSMELPIGFCRPTRNLYEYNAADIEAFKLQTAFLPNRA